MVMLQLNIKDCQMTRVDMDFSINEVTQQNNKAVISFNEVN